jgi:peptidoglycan hydrolase CwlO-like protein
LQKLQVNINEAKSKWQLSQAEMDVLLNDYNYELNKLNELDKKIFDMENVLNERKANVKQLEDEIPKLDKELADLNRKR